MAFSFSNVFNVFGKKDPKDLLKDFLETAAASEVVTKSKLDAIDKTLIAEIPQTKEIPVEIRRKMIEVICKRFVTHSL